jgi:hypothetical protein
MNFRFIIYISFIWLLMCFASSCKTVKRAVSFGERQDLSLSELVKEQNMQQRHLQITYTCNLFLKYSN